LARWLAHVGNSTFSAQDAHGIYRHIYVIATCNTLKSNPRYQPAERLADRGDHRPGAPLRQRRSVPAMTRKNREGI